MSTKFKNLYIDTSTLYSLDFDIKEDPRFKELKNILNLLGIKIYIPKIVLDELIILIKQDFKREFEYLGKGVKRLNDRVSNFNKFLISKINFMKPNIEVNEEELLVNLHNNIKEAGIEVFENPLENIKMQELLNMAINQKKPFASGDKGFKDAIILFSILEHIKKDIESECIFLTGNSKDFNSEDVDIKDLINKCGAKLSIIFSIEELNSHLVKYLETKQREIIELRKKRIKEFLDSQKPLIKDFINKASFDDQFLSSSIMFSRLDKIELSEIINSTAGVLGRSEEEGNVNINFDVNTKFFLSGFKYGYSQEKVKLGEIRKMPSVTYVPGTVDLEKIINVKGKIHIKIVDKEEIYSDLQLEEVAGDIIQDTLYKAFYQK